MNNENNKPFDKNTHQQSLELQNFAIRAPAIPLQRQDGSSHNACVGVEPCWRSMVMVQRILQILSAIELQQPSFQQQRATSRCYKYGGGRQAFSSLVLYVHTYINLHCIPKVSESITFTVTGSCLCVGWRTRTVTAAVTRTIGVRLRHILAWIGHKVVHWISARTLHTCRTMVSIFEYGATRTK